LIVEEVLGVVVDVVVVVVGAMQGAGHDQHWKLTHTQLGPTLQSDMSVKTLQVGEPPLLMHCVML